MFKTLTLITGIVCIFCTAHAEDGQAVTRTDSDSESPIYVSDGSNALMQAAGQMARDTLRFYMREMSWERRRIAPAFSLSAIKAGFPVTSTEPNAPAQEMMWIADASWDGNHITGILLNEPEWITDLAPGDLCDFPIDRVVDWMYADQANTIYGGFTVQAMRANMSAAERAEHDAAWGGLNFPNAEFVNLTFGQEVPTKWQDVDAADIEALASVDHPMAINMLEKFDQAFEQNTAAFTALDEQGFAMIHHEAVNGNACIVNALLQKSIDPHTPTGDGRTCAELALGAGWPSVVNVLKP